MLRVALMLSQYDGYTNLQCTPGLYPVDCNVDDSLFLGFLHVTLDISGGYMTYRSVANVIFHQKVNMRYLCAQSNDSGAGVEMLSISTWLLDNNRPIFSASFISIFQFFGFQSTISCEVGVIYFYVF